MTTKRRTSSIRDERGQSLVVVVLSMIMIVLMAAIAIDVADWFSVRHHAQVTADAAALAAANYMGSGGSTGAAISTATTYASNNNLPINSNNVTVDTAKDTVTVTVPTTGPLFFAGIALGSGPTISARAVASWLLKDCTSAGSGCAFMYAADNVCAGDTGVQDNLNGIGTINHGITIFKSGTGSGQAITGDVISASNITTNVNGNPTFGAAAYATGCNGPSTTSPRPYSAAFQRTIASQFPIDYRLIYSACPGTSSLFGTVRCVDGYPSYCTAADEGFSTVTTITTNAIYCNAGTGTASDPSTWNGSITVSTGGNATFIAGTVTFTLPSNSSLGPASNNNLLAYGAECNASSPLPTTCPTIHKTTTNPAVNLSTSGNSTITGDIFAPAGVIDTGTTGSPTSTGFLEGWDIVYNANGTAVGQGPSVTPNATFIGDSLTQ